MKTISFDKIKDIWFLFSEYFYVDPSATMYEYSLLEKETVLFLNYISDGQDKLQYFVSSEPVEKAEFILKRINFSIPEEDISVYGTELDEFNLAFDVIEKGIQTRIIWLPPRIKELFNDSTVEMISFLKES